MLRDLVLRSRSIRRFYEDTPVALKDLRELVDLARLTPSAANLQPLKYVIARDKALNERIFGTLAWAGYLKDWDGPSPGERPGGYVIILGDKEVAATFGWDQGIAAQTICLGAAEMGLGACMIGSIKREELRSILELSADRFELLLVIALGKPRERIELEIVTEPGKIEYYRDDNDVHHVPKRRLEDVLLAEY
ncbi:MAG TPA: nitroreductase family protein [Candidatus Hydrogenedentes bacterium]|nr:nitroreductase family protein [Candidatus Hydrogenedentota bacterium]HQH67281.1 nitroreductase family protein [Candidatus Hydrogenedentota bacterium]HQM50996.1 nitroreductase family protein [Candidatus Hydrogenedentota bacterium]